MTKKENPVDTAIALCAAQVRRDDYARYVMTLLMPAGRRSDLWAVFALHIELRKIPGAVREPMMALVRFQWWRDALQDIAAGQVAHHPVLRGIGAGTRAIGDLLALVDAHETAFKARRPLDRAQLLASCDAIGFALQRLANRDERPDNVLRAVGGAYEMTEALVELPAWWVHGRFVDPRLEVGEIARVRMDAATLETHLAPVLVELATRALSRVAEVPRGRDIVAMSADIVRRRSATLLERQGRVFAYRASYSEHTLAFSLLRRRWLGGR